MEGVVVEKKKDEENNRRGRETGGEQVEGLGGEWTGIK
jgi:hypothetical protein